MPEHDDRGTLSVMTRVRVARSCRRPVVALLLVAALTMPAMETAAAQTTFPRVGRHGVCTPGPSGWILRVVDEGVGLSVRFIIAGGAEGDRWNVFIDQNGVGFFQGSRVAGPNGFLRVRRLRPNQPGVDVFHGAGHNVETGEICRGHVKAAFGG